MWRCESNRLFHSCGEAFPRTRSMRVLRSLMTPSICSSCSSNAVRSPVKEPVDELWSLTRRNIALRANSEKLAPSTAEALFRLSYSSADSRTVSSEALRWRIGIIGCRSALQLPSSGCRVSPDGAGKLSSTMTSREASAARCCRCRPIKPKVR